MEDVKGILVTDNNGLCLASNINLRKLIIKIYIYINYNKDYVIFIKN